MYIQSVVEKCEELGHPITPQGLYYVGKKYGFIYKDEAGKCKLDKDRFYEWINKSKEEPPEGYISMKEASVELNIPLNTLYKLYHDGGDKSGIIRVGNGRGVLYANPRAVEEYKRQHKTSRSEWD